MSELSHIYITIIKLLHEKLGILVKNPKTVASFVWNLEAKSHKPPQYLIFTIILVTIN